MYKHFLDNTFLPSLTLGKFIYQYFVNYIGDKKAGATLYIVIFSFVV